MPNANFELVVNKQAEERKPEYAAKPKRNKRCCFDCSQWANTYCPSININDPYAPFLECGHLNIEKSGLLSVDDKSVVCGLLPSGCVKPFVFVGNILITPWVLIGHFITIYFVPAITSVFFTVIEKFICVLNIFSCGFTDICFPPNDRSVGSAVATYKSHTVSNLDCWHRGLCYCLSTPCYECFVKNEYEWARAQDLVISDLEKAEGKQADTMKLFSGRIEPSDVGQGRLGDCWLLASLACVAERNEECIKSLFLTRSASLCGYYKIRLYDVFNGVPTWRTFTVDDFIPVQKGTHIPLFTRPHGHELWVLLLEKAFAKMMGSYHALDGGKCSVKV